MSELYGVTDVQIVLREYADGSTSYQVQTGQPSYTPEYEMITQWVDFGSPVKLLEDARITKRMLQSKIMIKEKVVE